MINLCIQKATDIKRNDDGTPFAWTAGEVVKTFRNTDEFIDYVKDNINDLADCVVLSGSASLIGMGNAYLARELKQVNKLVTKG